MAATTRWAQLEGDRLWLAIALSVGGLVYISYLLTHTHPAYEGGLYLQMAEEIVQNGYGLPKRIPYYLEGGIPFAYPPLMFYVIALFMDFTSIDPVMLELYAPGLVMIAYLIPYYFTAKELLGSSRQAGLASVFFAVTPPVLRWHISAGGIVRSVAVLFMLIGVYVGLKIFRTQDRRWLWVLLGTILFTLTMLTHPVYTVFFAGSYLLLFAYYDRTWSGLLCGAVVAAGGIVLAAPWWLQIANTHGLDIYLTASGTHTGLTGGYHRIKSRFVYPLWAMNVVTPFYVMAFVGGIYALFRRRYFLPVWMVTASYVIGKQRFTFVAGSMLSAMFVIEVVMPVVMAVDVDFDFDVPVVAGHRKAVSIVIAVSLIVGAVGTGVAFAGSELNTTHADSTTQPQTVSSADLQAMVWIRNNTTQSAEFVVLGDTAEWLPYYTERTVLVSPWGAEWTSTSGYYEEYSLYRKLSTCSNTDCLQILLGVTERQPDYLYVPTEEYTVHGDEYSPRIDMIRAMVTSERYELRYENDGVMIFEIQYRERQYREWKREETDSNRSTSDNTNTANTVMDRVVTL
jgi:hypothetical protein